jgi:hypothetical protein
LRGGIERRGMVCLYKSERMEEVVVVVIVIVVEYYRGRRGGDSKVKRGHSYLAVILNISNDNRGSIDRYPDIQMESKRTQWNVCVTLGKVSGPLCD